VPSGERQARSTRHEHPLGEWMRVRRPPDARLSGLLDRALLGYLVTGMRDLADWDAR
jgi:hypothetical protein